MKVETRTCSTAIARWVLERTGFPNNTDSVIEWIDTHPGRYNNMLDNMDQIINQFNVLDPNANPNFQNVRLVKQILEGAPLPTIESFLADSSGPNSGGEDEVHQRLKQQTRYAKVIKGISQKMEKGEIGYQNTDTNIETLVVATIFQVFEEMAKKDQNLKDKNFESDRIIEALMEISSLNPDFGFFSVLSARNGMNWVEGSDRFSKEFRQLHGFK